MLIREAILEDINGLIFLGEGMFKESQFAQYDFNKQKVLDHFRSLVNRRNSIVLVAVNDGQLVAGFAAIYIDHWFGKCTVSYDIAFFLAPEVRGSIIAKRIIKKYIAWANSNKVDEIVIGNSIGNNSESSEKYFKLIGFEKIGSNYRMSKRSSESI